MSTATLERPVAVATGRDDAPSFFTLTKVELRKMTNTRAGFWLLFSIAAVTVLIVVLMLILGDADERNLRKIMEGAIQPAGIALPIVGILLVTSEWSQRTALSTFALVPNRLLVMGAKFAAALVLSLSALLFVRAVGTLGVVISEGSFGSDVLNFPATMLGQDFVFVATAMLGGVAFGALLLSSAPAIVAYFLLPIVFAALGELSFLDGAADWLDSSRTLAPLADQVLSGEQWAQAGTTLLVWLGLPAIIGLWRVRRAEIA